MGAIDFFFYFYHDTVENILKRMDDRRNTIEEMYGVSMPIPPFDITTVRAIDYYEYCCCDMLEDPEFFLYGGGDVTNLPESVREFNRITDRLHNEILNRCTGVQIGGRLRAARKDCCLTGEKVVELWKNHFDDNGNQCMTTQATISNHERGKVTSIKLIDLLRYCVIYKKATPNEIMLGCTYSELMHNDATLSLSKERSHHLLEEERLLTGDLYIDHLRKILIIMSEGKCELCGQNAPFKDKEGMPYLQLFLIPPNDKEQQGISLTNTVVLCPNCSSRIDILKDEGELQYLKEKAAEHSLPDLLRTLMRSDK